MPPSGFGMMRGIAPQSELGRLVSTCRIVRGGSSGGLETGGSKLLFIAMGLCSWHRLRRRHRARWTTAALLGLQALQEGVAHALAHHVLHLRLLDAGGRRALRYVA